MGGRCSERFTLGLNLFACSLMLLSIALRFYYVSIGTLIPGASIVFFVILAIYQIIFISLLVAAEFKLQRPRLYFDFLDSLYGRSSLIIFIELLIIDATNAAIIVIGLVVFLIAIIGIILGWEKGPDGVKLPSSAPPAEPRTE